MRTGAIAIVYGTRPEMVKLAPVIDALGTDALTIHTGQHPAAALDPIRHDLGLAPDDVSLSVTPTPRSRQIAEAIAAVTDTLGRVAPRAVLVQGDTNSTLAGALAARDLGLPVVHLEAGLRSFDRAMLEERNRIIVDHLAALALAPTEIARGHLLAEGIEPARIAVTGNTVVDAARAHLPDPTGRAAVCSRVGVTPGRFILATFHRPENVDHPEVLAQLLDAVADLPLPVVLPVHPRTRDRAAVAGVALERGSIRPIDPLSYRDFLSLEAEAGVIVTDSGGVQEEAAVLGRPVVVTRRTTERPETLGTVARLVTPGPEITAAVESLFADLTTVHARLADLPCPYGDGTAAAKALTEIGMRWPRPD